MANLISYNLSYLMKRDGLSGNDLSQQIGIPTATIQKLRAGDIKNPTIETLLPVCKHFNITVDNLVNDEYDKIEAARNEIDTSRHKNSVPLINLEDTDNFPNCETIRFISTDYPIDDDNVYAFEVQDKGLLFDKQTILVVDKSLTARNQDFVIVRHIESGNFSIKKVIFDDEYYLYSITKGLENKVLNFQDYEINGIIVCCIEQFKF